MDPRGIPNVDPYIDAPYPAKVDNSGYGNGIKSDLPDVLDEAELLLQEEDNWAESMRPPSAVSPNGKAKAKKDAARQRV